MNLEPLLDNEQTAPLLGITPGTLEVWRCKGKGPRYIKLGRAKQSTVLYDPADVRAWIESQKVASTSAYSAKA